MAKGINEERNGSLGTEGGYLKFVGCAQSYREEVQEPEILCEVEAGIGEVSREQETTLPSHTVTKYLNILGGTASLL